MNQAYILERSKRRKHLALHITPAGELIAKAPWAMPQNIIEDFIAKKKGWIEKQSSRVKTKIYPYLLPLTKNGFLYSLGVKISYHIELGMKNQLVWNDTHLIIMSENMTYARQLVLDHFTVQTKHYVEGFIEIHRINVKQGINQINYKTYKRRWGSCDSQNNLMFNTMLSALSPELIEYVVVHELAHFTQKHHQKSFYAEGERLLKGFSQLNKKI